MSDETTIIRAPWSEDVVRRLYQWQKSGIVHPYTCGDAKCRAVLIPTVNGWRCPDCSYRQNWCHILPPED